MKPVKLWKEDSIRFDAYTRLLCGRVKEEVENNNPPVAKIHREKWSIDHRRTSIMSVEHNFKWKNNGRTKVMIGCSIFL